MVFSQWMRMPGDALFAVAALLMAWDFLVKARPLMPRLLGGARTPPIAAPAPAE